MLDVEPLDGLRGRVLERIESPRRGFAWIWIAAPLAAAALIALAVVLPSRTDRATVNPVTTVATTPTPTPVQPPQPLTPRATAMPQVRPETVTARSSPRPVRAQATIRAAVAPDEAAADVVWIDALAAPAAISVTPVPPPSSPAVPSIDLAPAQIPALEIRAISDTPRERRNQE
jgi:hypothetical protein